MSARALALTQSGAGAWLGSIAAGAALGGVAVTGMWLDAWPPLGAAGFELILAIHERVGPVWLPMAGVAADFWTYFEPVFFQIVGQHPGEQLGVVRRFRRQVVKKLLVIRVVIEEGRRRP